MVYVFVFLGEFGFELLNWQGVVRKFAQTLGPEDKLICCSRANLYLLYEMADEFIDISDVSLFRRSRATAYRAIFTPDVLIGRRYIRSHVQQKLLPIQLQRHVLANSQLLGELQREQTFSWKFKQGLLPEEPGRCRFIFSTPTTYLNGCIFGFAKHEVDIYDRLDVTNNCYRQLEPDLRVRPTIEEQLGWSLDEPYVLVQGRKRDASTKQPSQDTLDEAPLLQQLGERIKTVLLTFDTGRWLDSYAEFQTYPNCTRYRCRSFPEQACLIHFAQQCLFFTEGDFGSHIYVPPFLGKDVIAIAPRSVYAVGSTPLDHWNPNVFRFGGQVIPYVAEEVLASSATIEDLLDTYFAGATGLTEVGT